MSVSMPAVPEHSKENYMQTCQDVIDWLRNLITM